MLSLRMIPLLTSAPFLLAAKLSSQRFNGLLAWLKICRGDKNKIHICFRGNRPFSFQLLKTCKLIYVNCPWNYQKADNTTDKVQDQNSNFSCDVVLCNNSVKFRVFYYATCISEEPDLKCSHSFSFYP